MYSALKKDGTVWTWGEGFEGQLGDGGGVQRLVPVQVSALEFGQFAADGEWLIEGVGVAPDVEVDNLPHETFMGRDRQLEVAIGLLEKKMKEQPVKPWKPAAIPAIKRQWEAGEAAGKAPPTNK